MIKIEHIALYCNDLEAMKDFYIKFFRAKPGEKYENRIKGFESYFLTIGNGGRLEIMQKVGVEGAVSDGQERLGFTHLAISVGFKEKVRSLTEELRKAGYTVVSECRMTGDGYFESVVLDPEGNRLEITV